jgi:alpha-beta hydrolase superfamily lysophospholipase
MAQEILWNFDSKDGKTLIHAVKWMPESGDFKAILQITHGMIEFIERYQSFAEYLTEQGYLVVGHDHIGHGASINSKDDWGYFAPDHASDILIADMHELRTIIQKEYPDKPYFILGHSMGSYMLRKYIAIHGDGLSGAILMGTGYLPDQTAKLAINMAKFLSLFFGWRHRSKLLTKMSFGGPYKKYDLTGADLNNSWLTKDTKIVDVYYHEPRCTYLFTTNGYKGMAEAILFDNQPENIAKVPKNLPVFLVSGAEDPVGDNGKGVKIVYEQYKNAGMSDITWKLYENDRHEILNELDKENVYHDILSWLNVHMKL